MGLPIEQTDVDRARMARFIMTLRARGIRDQRILNTFERVPRTTYLPGSLEAYAYEDWQLPIPCGQTIESPFVLAYVLEHLGVTTAMKVLEVGTGTGFGTALLARLCRRVYTVERMRELYEGAARRLHGERLSNVEIVHDDALGTRVGAGFDRILVHGAIKTPPRVLLDQLAPGGRMLVTVDGMLTEIERGMGETVSRTIAPHASQALVPGRATFS